jgi:hypothetical protein
MRRRFSALEDYPSYDNLTMCVLSLAELLLRLRPDCADE